MMEVIELKTGKTDVCREILEALPDWFELADARETYIEEANELPMYGCRLDDVLAGSATLKRQTAVACEVHLVAVRQEWHRRGIGKALVQRLAAEASEQGARFLTVKTLAPSHPDPFYRATRQFYEAIGFFPLEVFPTLWSFENPCLLMVKPI